MRIRRWLAVTLILVPGLSLTGCRRTHYQIEYVKSPHLSGEPDAVLRVDKNLTKPTLRVLLPATITNHGGAVIASITDAQYCGTSGSGARVLVQITQGSAAVAAANLLMGDCSLALPNVVANHQSDSGFSGILELNLSWSNWELTSKTTAFYPISATTFSQQDSAILQRYSNQTRTDNAVITSGNDVVEPISLAFAFSTDTLTIGAFQSALSVNSDWSSQAPMEPDQGYFMNNMQVAVSQSLLQSLMQKYNADLNYTTSVSGVQILFSAFSESAISTSGSTADGISVSAQLTSSQIPGCKVSLTTNWTGVPLTFHDASAVPNEQGLCLGLAQAAQTQLIQQLNNVQFISGTSRDFVITLAGQPAVLRFEGSFSTAAGSYVSIFGNGGIHAK